MKTTTHYLSIPVALGAILLWTTTVSGQTPSGQWDFDNGNLSATVGLDLTYADGNGGFTQQGTQFGTTTSFGIPDINGTAAKVMQFPAATNGMGYLMTGPAAANAGGSQVNEWTMIMDVLYPGASDKQIRPIIDTDQTGGPNLIIDITDGVGYPPTGPFVASISSNTWYRLGVVVANAGVDVYINGSKAGSLAGFSTDGIMSLTPSLPVLILGSTDTNAAVGYINSLQLWGIALNPGQMQALGGPSATNIPTVIPPVPSFIQSRNPDVGATGVSPLPNINIVLNQGSTVVNSSSIQLSLDGTVQSASVTATPPTFTISNAVTTILDPNSTHTLTLNWTDNTAGANSAIWSFTVFNYQNITLPAPLYLETFDAVAEGDIPAGWTVTNWTDTLTAGLNLNDPLSDSYKDWVVVSTNTYATVYPDTETAYVSPGFPPVSGNRRLMIPPIVLNGQLLSGLAAGNLIVAESDQRGSSQVQVLFTSDYDLTGRSNVFLSFHHINEQNQDNICAVEYSIDQGVTWLPLLYMFDDGTNDGDGSDVVTNGGKIDVVATFGTARGDQAHGLAFSNWIGAAVTTNLIPYIRGCRNDDPVQQKRIEVFRLAQADNQAKVRFRLLEAGTASWYFSVDNFGLYEINTASIVTPPADQTVSAGTPATFTVVAQSPSLLTYRWKHAGTNLIESAHFTGVTNATLTVSNCETNDAGSYVCVLSNSSGNVSTPPSLLTVVVAPLITTQPTPVVTTAGLPATFTGAALGRAPLVYTWLKDGSPVGPNSSTLNLAAVQTSDAGNYQLAVTNSAGGTVSAPARLIVAPGIITNNLVVHLTFDGNYKDSSGRGNDANAVGNPTLVTGKFGQAMQFTTTQDGSEIDYATLGYPNDLKFGAIVDFSISFWANYTQTVDDPPFISNKDWASSNNPGWGIFTQNNGHFRVNTTGTGGTKYDLGSSATPLVRDGTWHNIVYSHARGALVSVYVDGALISTRPDQTTGSVDTDSLNYNVNIGQDGRGTYTDGGSAGITNALIDDVGIWRRVLSAEEASGIYTSGQAGKDLSQAVVSSGTQPTISISTQGGSPVITYTGTLYSSSTVNGTYGPVSGASSPYTVPTGAAAIQFYRAHQ